MKVLVALREPAQETRFVDQVVTHLPDSIVVDFLSWRHIVVGRYDVVHLHWPEFLIRSRFGVLRLIKRAAVRYAVRRWRRKGTAVVRTLHNVAPHEPGEPAETAVLEAVLDGTTLFIRLNDRTPLPRERPAVTILHGDYRERFATCPTSEPVVGRVLFFGLLRPYKGVERLIECFTALPDADYTLRIVGKPEVADLRSSIETAVAQDQRVSARFGFVSDAALTEEVTASQLVVLPYAELHNSGALLVALSLRRPVLVPNSPTTQDLAREVGADWILLYNGLLTETTLQEAISRTGGTSREGPHLELRDWRRVAQEHVAAYETARRLVRDTA